jgi:hypothetical protein
VSVLSGVGKRALDAKLKAARKEQDTRSRQEAHDRRAADRQDPRPQILAPPADAPWIPQMQALNDVLGVSDAPEPPMRDIDGVMAEVRARCIPNMHALTAETINEGNPEKALPPPEQPLLTRLDEIRLSELIEAYIDYVNPDGQSVHLGGQFVKHFLSRTDGVLPTVSAIATLPIVMLDGTLLSKRGLDRKRGIVFRVPPHLLSVIPDPAACTLAGGGYALPNKGLAVRRSGRLPR